MTINPTKCPAEGFEWRGKYPVGSDKGAWYNEATGESLHPDFNHPPPKEAHWDYRIKGSQEYDLFLDGTWMEK